MVWSILFSLAFLAEPSAHKPVQSTLPLLVEFDELESMLSRSDLRLLDVRPREDYDHGHIPGAVWVDAKRAEELAAVPGALVDEAVWSEWLKPLGLSSEMTILVYDDARQKDAARFWWLLSYLGQERVGLINGGYSLWSAQGRPGNNLWVDVAPVKTSVRFRSDLLADREDVVKALRDGGTTILDARSGEEFNGKDRRSRRMGHVPAACHVEWKEFVDAEGRFLPTAHLRARLSAAGLDFGQPVITHCQGGGRAAVNAFAAMRAGLSARNYYLGWGEWGNRDDTPISTSAGEAGAEAADLDGAADKKTE